MKAKRYAVAAAGGLLVFGAGTAAAAALFGERLVAAAIEKAGPAAFGREVRVGGVEIEWGRHAAIAATRLTVADAAWTGNPALLRVRRAEVTVDLLDLLRLRLSPVRLALREPALHLARDEQGRWNLPAAGSGGAGGTGGRALDKLAGMREIEIENGEATVDNRASPGVEGRIAEFSARVPRGPEEGGIGFGGVAAWGSGDPIAFSGQAGSLAELLRGARGGGAEPFPIRVAMGPDTAKLSAAGRIARPLDLAGFDLRVEGRGDDLAPLLAAFGAAPAAPTPPFEIGARLTGAGRGWKLEDIEARLGGSEVRGAAAVSMGSGEKPRVSVDLAAPRLAVPDFEWAASAGRQGGALSGRWVDSEFPTAWLRRADADGDLRVERLEGLAAGPAELRLRFELEDGRLRLRPFRIAVAQGAAEGSATVDAGDGAAPELALLADAGGIRLGPLLGAFGVGQVAGTLETASVDLRGRGGTPREVAAALDGSARFRVVDGSLDIPGLSNLSMGLSETFGYVLGGGRGGGGEPTPVACAVGDLPVRRGVVRAERLVVVTPQVEIVAEGTIRLGDATADLTLVPRPLDGALLRVVVPVAIEGDLASPRVETRPEFRAGLRAEPADGICRKEFGGR